MTKKQREEAKRLARIARAQARHEAKQQSVTAGDGANGPATNTVGSQNVAIPCDLSGVGVATEQPTAVPTTNGLESQGNVVSGASGVQGETASDLSRKARVYGVPLNPRCRLIEFDDGTHGQLWVKLDADRMLNWRIWVKPDPNRPNPPGAHWVMDGSYNWRGIRIK